jgi:hypothetical protein
MIAWEKAKHWWDNHSTQDFWEAVGEHLSAGYVWNSPECFMLAKASRWNAEEQNFELGDANCWFVTLAAGAAGTNPVRECLRVAPYAHLYVAWCRRGSFEPRVYYWEKLMNKVGGQ